MSLTSLSTLATLGRTGPRRVTDLAFIERVARSRRRSGAEALDWSSLQLWCCAEVRIHRWW
jgi:hypothetical protein